MRPSAILIEIILMVVLVIGLFSWTVWSLSYTPEKLDYVTITSVSVPWNGDHGVTYQLLYFSWPNATQGSITVTCNHYHVGDKLPIVWNWLGNNGHPYNFWVVHTQAVRDSPDSNFPVLAAGCA